MTRHTAGRAVVLAAWVGMTAASAGVADSPGMMSGHESAQPASRADSAARPTPGGAPAGPRAPAPPHSMMGGKVTPVRRPPFKIVLPPGLPKVSTVTLVIHHRIFHEFEEARRVPLRTRFQIGDTDYSAIVTDFVPDFTLDLKARKITTISREPRNPAFRVVVREKGAITDTTWAFLNNPPHFAAKSMLAFQVTRIDFVDHAPIARDTLQAPADTSRSAESKP